MDISIQELRIDGFKSLRDVNLSLKGGWAMLSGENGTGKTSVYDAFLWLLTGKDSTGRAADVKPRDREGNRISGRDCNVEAVLGIAQDGKLTKVTLHRQLHEVWSKDAKSGEKIYSRDETLCWINDVPKKVDKEYPQSVASLLGVDDSMFQLLTSNTAFMAQHWSARRTVLLSLVPGDTEPKGFEHIGDILNGNTPEEAKARLTAQRKRHNDELNAIPARIDEQERSMPDVSEEDVSAAKAALQEITRKIADIDQQLTASPEKLKAVNAKYDLLRELRRQRDDMCRSATAEQESETASVRKTLSEVQAEMALATSQLSMVHGELTTAQADIESLEDRRQQKLDEYHEFYAQTYNEPTISLKCPTCNQPLPADQVQAARDRHKAEWEAKRKYSLQAITGDGKQISDAILARKARMEELQEKALALGKKIADDKEAAVAFEAALREQTSQQKPVEESEPYLALVKKISEVSAEIEAMSADDQRPGLEMEKSALILEQSPYQHTLQQYTVAERAKARIDELNADRARIGALLTQVERDLFQLGEYTRAKCRMLEESINDQFQCIRWKLFDIQKNGEIKDVCDATVNGIAYGDGLNNAAEVNAGIEIIRVLSAHYGVTLPCFVDNAESVNDVDYSGGQMILLVVTTEPELTLTVRE